MRTWVKTIVNKFAISNNTALILGVDALRSYLKLNSLPNKKVSDAKDHGKNYIKVRPPLVRHLLRDPLFSRCNKNVIKFLTFMHWKSNQFYASLITTKRIARLLREHTKRNQTIILSVLVLKSISGLVDLNNYGIKSSR